MAPRATAKKLRSEDYLNKLSGPKVDIYVGKKRKHYSIPKALLEYYSGYFARHFSPQIKQEGQVDDVFYLLDDDPDDFALIVDYLYRGAVVHVLPEKNDELRVARCLRFIQLAGKLEFGEAASVIFPALKEILVKHSIRRDPTALNAPEFIYITFSIVPAHHDILELLCQAAMPETMGRSGGKYKKVLEEVEGFLAETWRQFHACRGELRLSLPLNPNVKKTTFE